MIEVIYREDISEDSIHEPRNVKQIGSVDPKYRIYMEDTVLTCIRKGTTAENEVHFGLLMGELKRAAGTTYLFIRGMVRAAGKRNESENSLSGRSDREKYSGVKSMAGEKGESEEKRDSGEKWKTGEKCDTGEKKNAGEKRNTGEKNDTGERSDTGEKNDTGEKWDAGEKRYIREKWEPAEKRGAGEKWEYADKRDTGERWESADKRDAGEKRDIRDRREIEEKRDTGEKWEPAEKRNTGDKRGTAEKRETDERRRKGEKIGTGSGAVALKRLTVDKKREAEGEEERQMSSERHEPDVEGESQGSDRQCCKSGDESVRETNSRQERKRDEGSLPDHLIEIHAYRENGSSSAPLIEFDGETWSRLYEDINYWFPDMDILGWYASFPFLNVSEFDLCREIHYTHFSGADKVLFLCDRIEREEAFYRPDGAELRETEGYFTFFEKNDEMLKYQQENEPADGLKETAQAEVERRSIRQGTVGEAPRGNWNISAASILVTVALLAAVLVVNQYNRYLKTGNSGTADGTAETGATSVQALAVDGQVLNANTAGEGAGNGKADSEGAGDENTAGNGAGDGSASGEGTENGSAAGENENANGEGTGDRNVDGEETGDGNAAGEGAGDESAAGEGTENGNAVGEGAGDESAAGEEAGDGNTDSEGAGDGNTVGGGTGDENADGNAAEEGTGDGNTDSEGDGDGSAAGEGEKDENVTGERAKNENADGEGTGDENGNNGTSTTSENGGSSLENETVQTGSRVSARYYTVKNGETLYSICMDVYKTSAMVEIVRVLNDIGEDYVIQEGQKILLP